MSLESISPTYRGRLFVQNICAQLFNTYILGLYFFGPRISGQKLLLKCWWNWQQTYHRLKKKAQLTQECLIYHDMVVDAHRRGHVLPHDHGHLVRPEEWRNKNSAEHLFKCVPSFLEVVLDKVGGVWHAQVVAHHPPEVCEGL